MDIFLLFTLIIVVMGYLLTKDSSLGKKKIFLILSSILLVIISGLRNVNWGPQDNQSYFIYYSEVFQMGISDIFQNFLKDPGYHIFAKGVSLIVGDNYTLYLVIVSSIFVGSIFRLIYLYSEDTLLSLILLLALGIFDFSMMGVRQALAIAMVALSFEWLVKRNLFFRICFR